MRRSSILFGALWVVSALVLTAASAFRLAINPYNYSEFDHTWLAVFSSAAAVSALLCLVLRGRLLFVLASLTLPAVAVVAILFGGKGLAFLAFAWLLALAAMLGKRVLRLLAPHLELTAIEGAILNLTLGLAVLTLLTIAAGYAHLFYRSVFYGVLLILTAALLPGEIKTIHDWPGRIAAGLRSLWAREDLPLIAFTLAMISLALAGTLLKALSPSIDFDALVYHLGVPELYIRHHAIIPVPEEFRAIWCHNGEMLITLGLLVYGQPLPALLHLVFAVMTGGLVYEFARSHFGGRAGWLALLLYLSLPAVGDVGAMAYVDLMVTFYCVGFIYAYFKWLRGQDAAWLLLAGVFAGLGLGTKLNAGLVLVAGTPLIAAGVLWREGWRRAAIKPLLMYFVPLTLLGVPWMIRDWVLTGNPVFPFFNKFFLGTAWTTTTKGMGQKWVYLLRLPWDLIWNTDEYGEIAPPGFVAALPLLALPFMFARSGAATVTRRLWIFVVAYLLIWFKVCESIRYLHVLLPIFAVLAAVNLDLLWRGLCGWFPRRGARFAVGTLALLLAAPCFAFGFCIQAFCNFQNPERYPIGLWLGRESDDRYLARCLPSYNALKFIDRETAGEKKILSLGMKFRTYTTARITALEDPIYSLPLNQKFCDDLRGKYDYLILDRNYETSDKWGPLNFCPYVPLKFVLGSLYVFDLNGKPAAAEARNLLENPGFEQIDAQGVPAAYYAFGKPALDGSGGQAHGGKVGVRVDGSNGYYQRVKVEPEKVYTIGLWERAAKENGSGRLQINWLDKDLKRIPVNGVSITLIDAGEKWKYYQDFAFAPAGAACAQVYVNSHASAQVWIDDLLFVKGSVDGQKLTGHP